MPSKGTGLLVRSVALSDRGRVRSANEDAVGQVTDDRGVALFAVADGIGGLRAGDVASQTAVAAVTDWWRERTHHQSVFRRMGECLTYGHNAVVQAAEARRVAGEMGTTLTLLAIDGNSAYIANVGDSRIYRMAGGQLEQVTVDHTEARDMIRAGELEPDSPQVDELDHVLTRALGLYDTIDPEFFGPFELSENDVFLLCTDGLSSMAADSTLASVLRFYPLEQSCRKLVRLANFRGGFDNVTVQIVRVGGGENPLEPKPKGFRLDFEQADRMVLALLVLLAMGVLFLLVWFVT